ncbi:MAG TPA: hypothetical protein PKK00_12890 [Bacteroidales bacterium]|nr:hypothetical protein [Bacteroidales bacterium]HPS18131.1 hypothetical protein [Bacteroidales bacterium]
MKKIFLFILPIFLLTGCIDIVEEITLNADNSGSVKFYTDMGTLGNFAMSLGENYMKGTSLDQIKSLPSTAAALLKDVDGISNIKSTSQKGLYSVSFDFKNSKQLNDALYKLFNQKKRFYEPAYIKIKKHKIVKKNYAPLLRLFARKYKDQLKDNNVLKYISYKSVFNLPSEVNNFSNKKSTLSADKKKLEFTCTAEDLLTTNTNIGNKIKY